MSTRTSSHTNGHPTRPLDRQTNGIGSHAGIDLENLVDVPDPKQSVEIEPGRLAVVVERLRRFVSPPLADLIICGAEDALKSHRREITVAFFDLRGFTTFSECADPEDVMFVLHGYHQTLGRLISEHGGMIERFTGDGIMAYFNDPVLVPDPQGRAVALALSAHEQIAALAPVWRLRGKSLPLGVGISHGFATLGPIGFEERHDYAAIGNVTNIAARLCARARGGETLVCERVKCAIENVIETEPIGQLHLRGFRRMHQVFRVKTVKHG